MLTWDVEQHDDYENVVKIEANVGSVWQGVGPLLPSPDHWQRGKVEHHFTLQGE